MNFPNLSALAVRERSLTLFLLLLSLVVGTVSFFQLGRAEDPDIKVPMLVVSAAWPGASNQEMEDLVVRQIERNARELENVYRIQTSIRDGRADIIVQFQDYTTGTQFRELKYQTRKRMQDLSTELPSGVQGPFVNDEFSDVYFSLIAIGAPNLPASQLTREAERIRDRIQQIEGVLKVHLVGERPERIYIDFDRTKLASMGLSIADAFSAIDAFNRVFSAGIVETAGQQLVLRADTRYASVDRLARMPIKIGDSLLPLKDIAQIRKGYEEPERFEIRANGAAAVVLGVVMQEGQNGLVLGKRINDFLKHEQSVMPLGMNLVKLSDQSEAIDAAVSLFQFKFMVAVGVVMLVGFLALGFRAGLVVGLIVPITLGLTFLMMNITHTNLDRITLGALIIALGLLVDDAIIIIEMMLVKLEQGWDHLNAASYAWNVTAAPMLFGTLITMFGFVPIGFAKSAVGEYAGNIFWILAYALLVSWLVAVTFAPYLGVTLLSPSIVAHRERASDTGAYSGVIYIKLRAFISLCVRYRTWTVAVTVAMLLLSFAGLAGPVQKQFFPGSDRPEVVVTINLAAGSNLSATQAVVRRLEKYLMDRSDVRNISAYIGAGAPRFFISVNPDFSNSAFAKVIAVANDKGARDALVKELKARVADGEYPEARIRVSTLMLGPPIQWPVSFRVIGPDADRLREIATDVSAVVRSNPHIVESVWEWNERVPRLQLELDNDRLARLGLTSSDVAKQLMFGSQGLPLTAVRQDIRNVEVWARSRDDQEGPPVYELRNLKGYKIPLSQVATMGIHYEDSVVRLHNGEKFLEVMADVENAQPQDVTKAIWRDLSHIRNALPDQYRIEVGGAQENSVKAEDSIKAVFPLMLVLVLLCIMLQMRSFVGVFVVLSTAPLGVIGAVVALLVFNQPFGFVATLGLIGLGGILMRNTLILTQQVRDNLQAGWSVEKSIIEAAVMRSRPVALTAFAAAMAFIPLTSDTFWGPMAFILIGGVLTGTIVTLFFVPALYSICIDRASHKA